MKAALHRRICELFPGAKIRVLEPLAPFARCGGTTAKAAGYGEPIRIERTDAEGRDHALGWHGVSVNPFGHDRRADRFAEVLGAFDDFAAIPGHVQALDVGELVGGEALCSLHNTGEPYLITSYARGTIYANELRRIAARGDVTAGELVRVD